MKATILALIPFFIFSTIFGQKKTLDHTVYNDWNSIKTNIISNQGNYLAYIIKPHRGDGTLYYGVKSNPSKTLERAKSPVFSNSEAFLVTKIDPGYDTLRNLELEKVKKSEWVKDSLAVIFLNQDSIVKIPDIKRIQLSKEGDWLAYLTHSNEDPAYKEEEKKSGFFSFLRKKKEPKKQPKSNGNELKIWNPVSGESKTYFNVTNVELSNDGSLAFVAQHFKNDEDKDSVRLKMIKTENLTSIPLDDTFTSFNSVTFNESSEELVFLASKDTVEKNKVYDLYRWKRNDLQPEQIIDTNRTDLPEGLTVSAFKKPYYSQNGEKLFIGLKEIPEQEPEDTLLDKEKAKLDLWHWEDKRLQPQQLKEKKRDLKNTHLSVLHLGENKLVQLENDTLSIRPLNKGNTNKALGYVNEQYQYAYNWEYPWKRDYYIVNLENGSKELIKRKISNGNISPDGNFFVYYNHDENHYKLITISTSTEDCMTCFMQDTTTVWTRDVNGMPHDPAPIGLAGFTRKGEAIIHSKHDIWLSDLNGNNLWSLTKKHGKNNNHELRLKTWQPDSVFIDLKETYVHGIDLDSRDEHILELALGKDPAKPNNLFFTPHKMLGIKKATKSDDVIYRKMNVKDYPDLYLSNRKFSVESKISDANPQQAEYRWPKLEKIKWTTPEGIELDGLVYLPEDFDTTKSYPMLVYFYELYQDRTHYHYIPKPTASIIYATEYTSAEYVVFIPDVRYEPGYPARSAYDCIVSGTDAVLEKYSNIDSTRLGLQGQSWGGYQTAQLVTMTNKYKAAMAGAPVSNMFSAYGGIRWGSGLNRQFQYERTQSRIGKTIWEAPELYTENSPLFGVPNIETPLLIMHNDNDGAVPWYQGIELFTAMKRLGKPAWLLNYNGDEHNLMQNANRMDLSIRMRQFFDHYLKDEPAPKWLEEGLPAVEKGSEYRLEVE